MTDGNETDEANFWGPVTQKAVILGPDEQVLLVRRGADSPWVFPGGRVQEGEDADEALAREVREETGLSVTVGKPVQTMTGVWHTAAGDPMFTVVYACTTTKRAVALNHEHETAEWVPVADAIDRMPIDSLRTAVERACDDDG